MTQHGTIKTILDRGFGFIRDDDGSEIFFHHSACEGLFDSLHEGQAVEYAIGEGRGGKPCAVGVRPA